MVFRPKYYEKKEGQFALSEQISAVAHPCLHKEVILEFWGMLRRLDRRIVIADWQYNAPIAPVETKVQISCKW